MPAGARRRYTEAVKREAVRVVRESAHPVPQVARDLGIPDNVLYRWTSQHRLPMAEHTLRRQFTVEHPNRVWAGDITYVWTTEGWLYLAVVLDLYARAVIGWAMGTRLTVERTPQALTMALQHRTPTTTLLHHVDRGSQYAATSYQRLLGEHGIPTRRSRPGNCEDNACVERFFGRSSANSCPIGTTQLGTTRNRTSLSISRCSIIGCAGTPRSATIPRPSSRQGRLWLNRVSTESGKVNGQRL